MRFLPLFLLLAFGAFADGVNLNPAVQKTFTDCSSSGSTAQTVAGGVYLVSAVTETVWVCFADSASTCASGGTILPAGSLLLISIGNAGQSVSCRSAASTGDLQFTKAG